MSWFESLFNLYQAHELSAGRPEVWKEKELILLPPGYDTMKSQVEIVIDRNGDFVSAKEIPESDARITVPYPDRRTSGIKPLPLCDCLEYVAGDFSDFVYKSNGGDKSRDKFNAYVENLEGWTKFDPNTTELSTILKYIKKKSVVSDLIRSGVLTLDEKGELSSEIKIQKTVLDKVFVRYRIYGSLDPDYETAVWLNSDIRDSFLKYYLSSTQQTDLCFFTGQQEIIARTNPIKIRNEGDTQACLISSNDSSNFSYRGRFETKNKETGYNEALSVGFITSQKVHNALKWIIRRQGFTRDGVCLVSWESNLKELPNFYDSTLKLIKNSVYDDFEDQDSPDELAVKVSTNYVTAREINNALNGYQNEISNSSKMVILALDSATPGRLAMTYFKELDSSRYIANIKYWQESSCWRHESFNSDKGRVIYEGIPSFGRIAAAVYGTEQGNQLQVRKSGDKSPLVISTFDRLRPCILERSKLPMDMVQKIVQKASNPVAYGSQNNYKHVLHTACSFVKKYYWDRGEKYEMNLDENCRNRSYLFGRLLAVAEQVERKTFDYGETRTTNAERYMRQFQQTPFRTWTLIRRNTQTHLNRLFPGARESFKRLYGAIEGLFEEGDFELKKSLDGRFLLGYDCQREALRNKQKTENSIEGIDDVTNSMKEEE